MKNKAAVALGKLGGKAGKGEKKRRGDSEYYRDLALKRKKNTQKSTSNTPQESTASTR